MEQKKVFLYNTHLDNIINHPNEVVNRIKWVISFFKARQDCILLWRPHPLSIDTIKSMCPGLLIEYMELVKTFKCMANGIYDDSADMQRAIVVSDAYIGDMSSLVALYKETGKPLYLMDINVKEPLACSQFGNFAHFCCADVVGSKMYAAADNFNAFYIIDMNKNEVEYAAMFEGESKTASSLFQRVIAYKDRVYFIPYYAHALHWYDCTDGKIKKRYIVDGNKRLSEFVEAFVFNERMFLFKNKSDTVVIINLENDVIQFINNCLYNLDLKKAFNGNVFSYGMNNNNYAIVTSMCESNFIVFDMDKCSCHSHSFTTMINESLMDVTTDGDAFYFLTIKGNIIKSENNFEKGYIFWQEGKKCGEYPFSRIIYDSGRLWLLPNQAEEIIYIEVDTKVCYNPRYPKDFKWNTLASEMKCPEYYLNGRELIILPRFINELLRINLDTIDIRAEYIALPNEFIGVGLILNLTERCEETGKLQIFEERICPFAYFLDYIASDSDSVKRLKEKGENCGRAVWGLTKNRIEKDWALNGRM